MAAIASPNLTVTGEHISAPLTDFSLGYHPMGFVAEQICPVNPVKKRNDVYYKWDKAQAFRVTRADGYGSMKADGARAVAERFGATTDGYRAYEWALETDITDEERDNADTALQLEQSRVRRVQDKILLDYELRVATLLTTTANFTNSNTVTNAGASQWNNSAFASLGTTGSGHSAIYQQLLSGINQIRINTGGLIANTIVLPFAVAVVVGNDPGFADLAKYTRDLLSGADVFGSLMPPKILNMTVLIPTAGYTTTQEGETVTPSDVWGKNVLLAYVDPTPSLDSLTLAKTFRSRPWQVKTYRDEFSDKTIYRPSFVQIEKLVAQDCGYLIAAAVA